MARISERPHERRTALEHVGYVDLPPHTKPGGFDHAAVHGGRGLLYVAHTANDAVDVIDCTTNTYLRSIPHLTRVAGALVSETHDLVFTSNRGEDTVGIFSPSREETVAKVKVGVGPNGLAYGADSATAARGERRRPVAPRVFHRFAGGRQSRGVDRQRSGSGPDAVDRLRRRRADGST